MPFTEASETASMELSDYDRAILKVGGAFRLSVLLQKRVRELVRGARPLVEVVDRDSPIDIALREVLAEKVEMGAGEKTNEGLVAALEKAMTKREKADKGEKDKGEGEEKKKKKKS
jgi:DNA-directed RNA polymerase subunit K/omega